MDFDYFQPDSPHYVPNMCDDANFLQNEHEQLTQHAQQSPEKTAAFTIIEESFDLAQQMDTSTHSTHTYVVVENGNPVDEDVPVEQQQSASPESESGQNLEQIAREIIASSSSTTSANITPACRRNLEQANEPTPSSSANASSGVGKRCAKVNRGSNITHSASNSQEPTTYRDRRGGVWRFVGAFPVNEQLEAHIRSKYSVYAYVVKKPSNMRCTRYVNKRCPYKMLLQRPGDGRDNVQEQKQLNALRGAQLTPTTPDGTALLWERNEHNHKHVQQPSNGTTPKRPHHSAFNWHAEQQDWHCIGRDWSKSKIRNWIRRYGVTLNNHGRGQYKYYRCRFVTVDGHVCGYRMKSHKTNPADDDDDKHTVYESKARHDHGTGAEDEPGMDGEELCEEAEEEDDGVDESMAHLDNANDPDDAAADQQHVQADPGSVVMTNMGFEQSDDEGPLEDVAENDASSLLLQNIDVNVLGETIARGFRLRNIWIRKRRIESFKARQASLMAGGGGGGVLDAVQSSGHKHAEFDGQNSASDGIEHAHVEADNGTENVDDNDEESDAAAVKAVIASIVHSVSNEMDGAAGFGMEVDDGDVITARAPSPSNNDEVQQNAVVNNNNDDRSSVFETNTTTTELGVVDDADNNVNSSSSGAKLRWTLIGHWGRTELFKEVVKRELKLFGKNGNFSYYYKCCAEQCAYKLRASRLRYVAGDAFNVHELGTHSGEHPLPRHGKKSGISLSSECVRKRVNKEHRKLDERACRMARSCSSFEYKWLGVSNSWFKEELDQFVEDQELQLYTWLGLSKLYYRCTKRPEPNDFPCPFRLRATLNKEENEEGNEPSSTDTYTISESYEWHSHQTEMVRRKRNVLQRVRLFEWDFLREIDDPQTLDKFRREHYVYAPVDDFDLLVQGTLACQWEPRQRKDTTPKCPYRMLVYKEFADGPLKVYEKGHHVHEQPPMLKPCEPIRPNRRHQKNALSKRIKMSRIESRRRERLRQKLRGDVKAVVQLMVTSVVHQLDGVEMLKQIVVGNERNDDTGGAGRKRKRRQKTKSGGGRRRRRRRTAVQTRSAKRSKMEDDGIEAGGSGDSVSQRMGAYLLDSSSDEAPPVEQRAAVGPQRERRRRRVSFLGIGTRVGAYLDNSSSDEAEVCPDEEVDKALNVPLADDVVVAFHACPCPDQLLEDDTDMENDTGRGEQRIDQHESIETVVHNVDIVSERDDDDDDRPRPLLSTPNVPTNEERDRQMLFAVGMRASPVIEIANFEGIAMRRSFKMDTEDMSNGMINYNCELVVGEEDLPDDRTMMQMKRSNTVNNRGVGRSSNKPKQKMTTINNHRRKGSAHVRKAVKLIREKGTGMKKTKKKPVRKRLPLKRSREQSTKSREKDVVVVRKKLRTSTTVQTATKTTTHTVVDRRHERRSSLMSAKKSHNKNTTTKQRVEEVQKLKHTAAADHHPVDHHRQLTHSAPLASAAYVPPYPYSSIGTKHRTPPSSSTSHHHHHHRQQQQQQQHTPIFSADDLLRQHGFGTVVIQQPIFSLSDADTMAMLKQIGAEQRVSLVERSGSFLFIPPKGSVHYLGGKLLALTHSTDHIRVDEFREGNLVGTVERWPRTIDALPLFIKHLHQKLFVFFA